MGSQEKRRRSGLKNSEKKDLYHDYQPEKKKKLGRKEFEKLLREKEIELVKLQEWVKANKLKVVVIFEGRDAAGKGGVIKTICRMPESKDMQDSCSGDTYRKGKNPVVFSAVCDRIACRR